ncbi:hypothetical protein M0805_006793 [Coniferiporia weirii]|nr:hypothetical protein M0805_006793 [Coniferiporia weirii]
MGVVVPKNLLGSTSDSDFRQSMLWGQASIVHGPNLNAPTIIQLEVLSPLILVRSYSKSAIPVDLSRVYCSTAYPRLLIITCVLSLIQIFELERYPEVLVLALDVAVFTCAFYYLWSWLPVLWLKRNIKRLPYPPGPKGFPLIGNIFNMPSTDKLEQVREWAQQHGDLTFLKAMGSTYLLVNTYNAAVELFEKRGHNYSSRPRNTLLELG